MLLARHDMLLGCHGITGQLPFPENMVLARLFHRFVLWLFSMPRLFTGFESNLLLLVIALVVISGVENATITLPIAERNATGDLVRFTSLVLVLRSVRSGESWDPVAVFVDVVEVPNIPALQVPGRYILRTDATYVYRDRVEEETTFLRINTPDTR